MAIYKKTQNIRAEILVAAKKFFFEHGYKKTSIDMIAKSLNISKGHLSYYFKSKDDLGSEIYTEYTKDIKNKVAEKMYLKFGKYDLSIATAVEFRIVCRMYRQYPETIRFYEDMVTAMFTNVAKHGPVFLRDLNMRYKLNLNKESDELHFIYYAWNGAVASVLINYYNGGINMPYDMFEDERIRLPLYLARLSTEQISDVIERSREITDELGIIIKPYFEVE